jgi:hypothetical protein
MAWRMTPKAGLTDEGVQSPVARTSSTPPSTTVSMDDQPGRAGPVTASGSNGRASTTQSITNARATTRRSDIEVKHGPPGRISGGLASGCMAGATTVRFSGAERNTADSMRLRHLALSGRSATCIYRACLRPHGVEQANLTRRLWRPLLAILRIRSGREPAVEARWVPPHAWRSSPTISTTRIVRPRWGRRHRPVPAEAPLRQRIGLAYVSVANRRITSFISGPSARRRW